VPDSHSLVLLFPAGAGIFPAAAGSAGAGLVLENCWMPGPLVQDWLGLDWLDSAGPYYPPGPLKGLLVLDFRWICDWLGPLVLDLPLVEGQLYGVPACGKCQWQTRV
jgi:hypothetical protein